MLQLRQANRRRDLLSNTMMEDLTMEERFLIKDTEENRFLHQIYLGNLKIENLLWTEDPEKALSFEVEEEAKSTINFILDVIDWNLEGYLMICRRRR